MTPIYGILAIPRVHGYWVDLSLGSVGQRDQLVPKVQKRFQSAQHSVSDLDSIPRFEKAACLQPR